MALNRNHRYATTMSYTLINSEGNSPHAPVLVFLPGVNCGAWFWEDALPYFLPQYKVIRFNNPGTGGARVEGIKTVQEFARKVINTLDELNITKFCLIGHSMGGYSAQEVALIAGKRVEKLVLIGTSYGQPQTTKDMFTFTKAAGKTFQEYNHEVLVNPEKALTLLFGQSYRDADPQSYISFIAKRSAHLPEKAVSALHLAMGGMFSSVGRVHRIQAPTLVIHGEDDPLVTATAGQKLAEQLPNAHLWILQGVRHFPTIENREVFPRIRDFLLGAEVGESVKQSTIYENPLKRGVENVMSHFQSLWKKDEN